MKAIVIENYGGREQLREREVEKPQIGEDQVLLEVHATSVNPIDWKMREGYLKEMFPFEFPIILGWDAAGVVAETGSNVSKFKTGDRVFTRPATTKNGTYAEFTAVDEDKLAIMPEKMSFEEAAAIPLAGLTAYQCLVDLGNVQEGDKVLVHAGAGGVGIYALQIARSLGAYVATTASGKNEEFVRSLGADHVINYQNENFNEVLQDFDFVLDSLGGEIQTKSYEVLKKDGKLISIVNPPDEEEAKKPGVTAGFHWLQENGAQLAELAELYNKGQLQPIVGSTFEFSEAGVQGAHELSETHHARGKIVIKVK